MGDVIGDLNSRRGMVGEFLDKPGGIKLIKASVPLSEMFQYVSTLRGMTKGRAQVGFGTAERGIWLHGLCWQHMKTWLEQVSFKRPALQHPTPPPSPPRPPTNAF